MQFNTIIFYVLMVAIPLLLGLILKEWGFHIVRAIQYYYYTFQRRRRLKKLETRNYGVGDEVNIVMSLREWNSPWHCNYFYKPEKPGFIVSRIIYDKTPCTVKKIVMNDDGEVKYMLEYRDNDKDSYDIYVRVDEIKHLEVKDWRKVIEG